MKRNLRAEVVDERGNTESCKELIMIQVATGLVALYSERKSCFLVGRGCLKCSWMASKVSVYDSYSSRYVCFRC